MEHEGDVDAVEGSKPNFFKRFLLIFNGRFQHLLDSYEKFAYKVLRRPGFATAVMLGGLALIIAAVLPVHWSRAYFPRTDPGQFIINVHARNLRFPSQQLTQRLYREGRKRDSQCREAEGYGHDCLEHRRLSRSLGNLHH